MFAGTINGHGALTVAVTRRRADTTLARIVHLVESAQAKRAPLQQFIDRFAAWYTPSVVILALARGDRAGPRVRPAVRGVALSRARAAGRVVPVRARHLDAGVDRVGARRRGAAGRARQGRHSPRAAGRRARRGVRQDRHGDHRPPDARCACIPSTADNADIVLALAASVESQSEHPIARGDSCGARRRAGSRSARPQTFARCPDSASKDTCAVPAIVCGTPRLFAERGVMTPAIAALAQACRQGRHVAGGGCARRRADRRARRDGSPEGRRGAASSSDLRAQGVARVAMITGDHDAAAQATGTAARRG